MPIAISVAAPITRQSCCRGHGAVVVVASLPRAVARSVYLQVNAQHQVQTIALGGNPAYLDPAEARKVEKDVWDTEGFNRA